MFSIKPLFDPIRHRSNIENYMRAIEPITKIKVEIYIAASCRKFTVIVNDGCIHYSPVEYSPEEQKLLDQCDEMIDYYFTKFNLGNETC